MTPETPVETVPDSLLDLQLRVARRADELQQQGGEPQDRQYWLRAEQEILSVQTDTLAEVLSPPAG
jgi:hypothetical protein